MKKGRKKQQLANRGVMQRKQKKKTTKKAEEWKDEERKQQEGKKKSKEGKGGNQRETKYSTKKFERVFSSECVESEHACGFCLFFLFGHAFFVVVALLMHVLTYKQ